MGILSSFSMVFHWRGEISITSLVPKNPVESGRSSLGVLAALLDGLAIQGTETANVWPATESLVRGLQQLFCGQIMNFESREFFQSCLIHIFFHHQRLWKLQLLYWWWCHVQMVGQIPLIWLFRWYPLCPCQSGKQLAESWPAISILWFITFWQMRSIFEGMRLDSCCTFFLASLILSVDAKECEQVRVATTYTTSLSLEHDNVSALTPTERIIRFIFKWIRHSLEFLKLNRICLLLLLLLNETNFNMAIKKAIKDKWINRLEEA